MLGRVRLVLSGLTVRKAIECGKEEKSDHLCLLLWGFVALPLVQVYVIGEHAVKLYLDWSAVDSYALRRLGCEVGHGHGSCTLSALSSRRLLKAVFSSSLYAQGAAIRCIYDWSSSFLALVCSFTSTAW